jgi:hypothetical protein
MVRVKPIEPFDPHTEYRIVDQHYCVDPKNHEHAEPEPTVRACDKTFHDIVESLVPHA